MNAPRLGCRANGASAGPCPVCRWRQGEVESRYAAIMVGAFAAPEWKRLAGTVNAAMLSGAPPAREALGTSQLTQVRTRLRSVRRALLRTVTGRV